MNSREDAGFPSLLDFLKAFAISLNIIRDGSGKIKQTIAFNRANPEFIFFNLIL